MKLLIATCDSVINYGLRNLLNKKFLIDTVASADDALQLVHTIDYKAIIIDAHKQKICAIDLCTALRKIHISTPILVMSDIDTTRFRVMVLRAGADDFIKRKYNDTELVARVEALVRRSQRDYASNILKVRDLVVDLDLQQASRGKTVIHLRKKEFEILVYLMNSTGRIVSRDMILQNAWEVERENWHNTVDVHIKHLRDKVDKPFARQPLIKTVYGMGYKFG